MSVRRTFGFKPLFVALTLLPAARSAGAETAPAISPLPDPIPGPAAARPLRAGSGDDRLPSPFDERRSVPSSVALPFPLRPAWTFPYIIDVRIWGNVVLVWSRDGLHALDLDTGEERWRRALEVGTPTGVTVDGRTVVKSHDTLAAIDVRTGRSLWERPTSLRGQPWVVGEWIYQRENRWVQRFRLADGADAEVPALMTPFVPKGFLTQGRNLYSGDHWLYNMSIADPLRGTKFYDGGDPVLLSGPYLVTRGWYYRAQAFRIDGERLTRLWDKRADRSAGYCLVPHGRYGAVLLMLAPNDGPRRLTLTDLPTGRTLWERDLDIEGGAVSAGNRIAVNAGQWAEKRDANGNVTREWIHRLHLLDDRTGRTVWRSRTDLGTPLAASQGRLFTSIGNRMYCLR